MPLFYPSSFSYTQATPSSTWVIAHNLGNNSRSIGGGTPTLGMGIPVVTVYINYGGALQEIVPQSIIMNDANTVTVSFGEDQTGTAIVVV